VFVNFVGDAQGTRSGTIL